MYEALCEEEIREEEGEKTAKKIPIMADLSHTGAAVKAVLVSPKAIETKSGEALEDAMQIIRQVSKKVVSTVETEAENRPSEVKVDFGLKLTAEGRAVITRAEKDINLKVTLVWKREA